MRFAEPMMDPGEQAAYDELAGYTLLHADPAFIHQHVVDAFRAQHASPSSKPIGVAFALIGLYLHVERGQTGRDVQMAHARLSRRTKVWPRFETPLERGDVTVRDVIAAPGGPRRDEAIERWCAAVWKAWSARRSEVITLLRMYGELGSEAP